MKGSGGDHKWRGDWYPIGLIADDYFQTYAEELTADLGLIKETSWPYSCIDWEKAVTELQQDYSQVDYNGVTYWYR